MEDLFFGDFICAESTEVLEDLLASFIPRELIVRKEQMELVYKE